MKRLKQKYVRPVINDVAAISANFMKSISVVSAEKADPGKEMESRRYESGEDSGFLWSDKDE